MRSDRGRISGARGSGDRGEEGGGGGPGALAWAVHDSWALTARAVGHLRHRPGQLVATVIFPVVMVILFGYVFGSAIAVPGGGDYREFLMPGLFAMTAVTSVMSSALLMSTDAEAGIIDRFRSMPISRAVVPLGRTTADLVVGLLGTAVLVVVGLVAGWRVRNGLGEAAIGLTLILLVRYALSWVGALIGLSVRAGTVDSLVPLMFPITMLSNAFVPTVGMPTPLRLLAEWNPVSALVVACRELFGNPGASVSADAALPLRHPVPAVLAWSGLILLVLVPLVARSFQRLDRR